MKKIILLFGILMMNLSVAVWATEQASLAVFTVTSKALNTTFGTISPVDNGKSYNEGDAIIYTLTPAENCELLKLSVNGVDKTAEVSSGKFNVASVSEDMIIIASFRPVGQKYYFTMSAVGGYPANPPSASNLPITRTMFDPETKSCTYSITNEDYRKYVAVRTGEAPAVLSGQPAEVTTAKWYVVGVNFCMTQPGVTKPGIYKFTYSWNDTGTETERYFMKEEFLSMFPFTVNIDVSTIGWTDDIYVHVKGSPERTYKMQAKQTAGWHTYTFENETEAVDIYFTNGENGTGNNQSAELLDISSSICYAVKADCTLAISDCPAVDAVLINTADELVDLLSANTNPDVLFKLTTDIDLGAWIDANSNNDIKINGWKSLGTQAQPITGTLDGAGFFLYDIWSNRPTESSSGGFIARAKALTIKNLGIKTKDGKRLTGKDNMGGFVCDFDNVHIENCCFNGIVKGEKQVGAFFGQTQAAGSSIKNSYAYGGVYGIDNVGGLWGKTTNLNSSIEGSYSMVTVNGQGGQGSAAGIIASADMSGATPTDIVVTVKNSLVVNDTISGAWAVATVCAYNKNVAHVNVINTVQMNNVQQIIQGNTGNASCVNASYTRTKQQIFETDTVFTNRAWDLEDTWQLGNANYPAPVLKNLTMAYQPAGLPKHLGGILSDFISITVGEGKGTIEPGEPFSVKSGSNVEFIITPEENYSINKLLVNGVDRTSGVKDGKYTVVNTAKMTYTVVVNFELTVNIQELEANTMMVYPNPTDGKLFIKTDTPISVSVYDNVGRLLQTTITASELDISTYPSGFYLLKMKNQYVKIIKK